MVVRELSSPQPTRKIVFSVHCPRSVFLAAIFDVRLHSLSSYSPKCHLCAQASVHTFMLTSEGCKNRPHLALSRPRDLREWESQASALFQWISGSFSASSHHTVKADEPPFSLPNQGTQLPKHQITSIQIPLWKYPQVPGHPLRERGETRTILVNSIRFHCHARHQELFSTLLDNTGEDRTL